VTDCKDTQWRERIALRATPSVYMFFVSRSTPGGKSSGRRVGDGKAYGQFADNVKLIDELKLKLYVMHVQ
jgi:hypothetical protein